MTPLEEVLAGREDRAHRQQDLLKDGGFIVQITLNVPGWPKHLEGEEAIIVKFHNYFIKSFSAIPKYETIYSNAAGLCCLMLYCGSDSSALAAKRIAVRLEEEKNGGRIVDMDVVMKDRTISRADLKLSPRSCIVCGKDAKTCAKQQKHSNEEVRAAAEKILSELTVKKHKK